MLRAAVPKTTIDEDRNPQATERNIRAPPRVR
jgi:hypothetical protein